MNGTRHGDFRSVGHPDAQHGRFRHGRSAVIHGGIGDFRPGEMRDHGLVFVNGLQDALADFRLVRRVSRIKFGASDDGIHHRRNEVMISPGAGKRCARRPVFFALRLHPLPDFLLGERGRHAGNFPQAKFLRNIGKQLFDAADADGRLHLRDVFGSVGAVIHGFSASPPKSKRRRRPRPEGFSAPARRRVSAGRSIPRRKHPG